jgi:transcriptional regulator with XRE-family HTH domain
MIVRKLRLQRGWSQEQLAEMMDVSIRTVQRIERGQKPGLETSKSLAAVFGVDIATFNPGDSTMNESQVLKIDELLAMQYVKGIIEFYGHVLMYTVFTSVFLLNGGWHLEGILWPFFGWGLGLLMHGLWSYDVFSRVTPPKWERQMVEKRLGRQL